MFNGGTVTACHILRPAGPESVKQAQALKLGIEKTVADQIALLPATTPPLQREQTLASLLVKTFAAKRRAKLNLSVEGSRLGDLGEFPRVGLMVEPFAKAAFELQPFQISNPVETQFGVHLILVTQTKPGRPTTYYEQAKPFVQEIYGLRLRDAIVAKYRGRSRRSWSATRSDRGPVGRAFQPDSRGLVPRESKTSRLGVKPHPSGWKARPTGFACGSGNCR